MNVNHEIIDDNTFIVFTDNDEEITYTHSDNADSHDIFSYVFIENEIERRILRNLELKDKKKKQKVKLSQLKKDLKILKRIKKEINDNKEYIVFLRNRLNNIKNDFNVTEVSRKTKKLVK